MLARVRDGGGHEAALDDGHEQQDEHSDARTSDEDDGARLERGVVSDGSLVAVVVEGGGGWRDEEGSVVAADDLGVGQILRQNARDQLCEEYLFIQRVMVVSCGAYDTYKTYMTRWLTSLVKFLKSRRLVVVPLAQGLLLLLVAASVRIRRGRR